MSLQLSADPILDDQWEEFIAFSAYNSEDNAEWEDSAPQADYTSRHACNRDSPRDQGASPSGRKLGFLSLSEWNEEEDYSESPSRCLQYTIEWKITVNNRAASRVY